MDPASSARPRVSRETRMLITTIVISIVSLWVLSRIRFPEREAAPAPVPPILAPLIRPPSFADLAAAVAETQAEVIPYLFTLAAGSAGGTREGAAVQALRIGNQLAVALTAVDALQRDDVAGHDRATGLTVIKAPPPEVAPPSTWSPRLPEQPRYLFAAHAGPDGLSMRPLFIDGLSSAESPLWPPPVWTLRSQVDAEPGTFVFTSDGLFAGLVIELRGRGAIVPGDAVLREAERVRQAGYKKAGRLDVEVRMLTPSITSAIGEASGVVVAWVDPIGAAAGKLAAGDLVEAVDGALVPTIEHWVARTARLAAGEAAVLHVRRQQDVFDVTVIASESHHSGAPILGLTMRASRGAGAEILGVARGSVADRAGLKPGDLITSIGAATTPLPAAVTRAFAAVPDGGAILVAITRGDRHDIVALTKR
jgi:hypothetical protein